MPPPISPRWRRSVRRAGSARGSALVVVAGCGAGSAAGHRPGFPRPRGERPRCSAATAVDRVTAFAHSREGCYAKRKRRRSVVRASFSKRLTSQTEGFCAALTSRTATLLTLGAFDPFVL